MKIASIVLVAAAWTQFISSAGKAAEPKLGEESPALLGKKAPAFRLESILQAPGGARASFEVLKGKVVVLEFWATWCGPCIAAIPHLNQLADKFKDEPIQFIAITDQDEKTVRPFLRSKPMHAWIGLDTNRSMFEDYGVISIPQTVIVDRNGSIVAITHPAFLTEEHLKDALAGKKIASAQHGTDGHMPELVPAVSKPEPEALFQLMIRPSQGGASRSVSNKGSLTVLSATVLDILSSSYKIGSTRIVPSTALPEGRYDFIIKTPGRGNEGVSDWLCQAVESTFGVTAQREVKQMGAFVLKAGQLTEHLAPTASPGVSSLSSGGGSLNCVNQSMSSLAGSLEEILKKPVINETGLTNGYDFQLLWNEKPSEDTEPNELGNALREQLGLELAPAMRSVELLKVTVANPQAGQSQNRVME